MSNTEQAPPGVDIGRPSVARMYDYFLGGTDNFEVDRVAGERVRQDMPEATDAVWANRGFLQRSVRWLAQHGIRQFIDMGAGLPTMNNTHDAAQAVAPDARVLYADNDPMVRVHANKLLEGSSGTAFITADFRDPDSLFGNAAAREAIDFSEPVGLLVVALTHFIPAEDDPAGLIRQYMDRLAPGSYLGLSAATSDRQGDRVLETLEEEYSKSSASVHLKTYAEVERFFDGLELVEPYEGAGRKLAYIGEWGAEDPDEADSDGSRWAYCGVARKTA